MIRRSSRSISLWLAALAAAPGAAMAQTPAETASAPAPAHIQVRTSDGKGDVAIDGVVKGEGRFSGDVPPGPHSIVVTREGYQKYEKTMTIVASQTWAETVTLQPNAGAGSGTGAVDRGYEGVYGGVGVVGMFGVGGTGDELETNCSTLGASSCATPEPFGGALFAYVGWTWDPVGFELVGAGMIDRSKPTATFDGSTSTGAGAIVPSASPARTETFTVMRYGGLVALRARVAFQTSRFRGTLAAGPGVSVRLMSLTRQATATDNPALVDTYAPDSVTYVSPALSMEGAIEVRLSDHSAMAFGLFLWADNASVAGSNAAPPSMGHALSDRTSTTTLPVPIPTPQYHIATGSQVLLGPFIGLHFGP